MTARGDYVRCWSKRCNWRGRKVRASFWRGNTCECDTICTHSPYGPCPRCGGRVADASFVRDMDRWAKEDMVPALEALAEQEKR